MVGNMALAQRKVLIMAEGDFGGANKALAVG